jgi:hypothetical protein
MPPDAKKSGLLYVSEYETNDVYAHCYPKGKFGGMLRGILKGFVSPSGLCADRSGDVFVTSLLGCLALAGVTARGLKRSTVEKVCKIRTILLGWPGVEPKLEDSSRFRPLPKSVTLSGFSAAPFPNHPYRFRPFPTCL